MAQYGGKHVGSTAIEFYLILILCNFNLNPSISLNTPDNADNMTTFIVVYK